MRIFLSSTYSRHPGGPDGALIDAVLAMGRASDAYGVPPVLHTGGWDTFPMVWSPVFSGRFLLPPGACWRDAMRWCLSQMRGGRFTHLVLAATPNRGKSVGMAAERRAAEALGLTVIEERIG